MRSRTSSEIEAAVLEPRARDPKRAATSASWVADDLGEAELARAAPSIRSSTRAAGVGVELPGRLIAQQQLRLAARAPARSPPAGPRRPRARPGSASSFAPSPTSASSSSGSGELAAVGRSLTCRERDVLERGEASAAGSRPGRRNATPAARTWPRAAASSEASGSPRQRHLSRVGHVRPPSTCSSVVFPDPDGPKSPTRSPAAIASRRRLSASTASSPRPWTTVTHRQPRARRASWSRSCDDASVAHLDHPVGRRATRARVGHDDDGAPERVAQLAAARRARSCSLAASSSPVGSSASTSGASRADAAAIATRCCSPPDSAPARWSPRDRARMPRAHHLPPEAGSRCPGEPQAESIRSRAPLSAGHRLSLWKHERDVAGSEPARARPRPAAASGWPPTRTSPAEGSSSAAASDEHRALAAAGGAEHRHQLADARTCSSRPRSATVSTGPDR